MSYIISHLEQKNDVRKDYEWVERGRERHTGNRMGEKNVRKNYKSCSKISSLIPISTKKKLYL